MVYESVAQPRFVAFLVLRLLPGGPDARRRGDLRRAGLLVELRTQEIGVRMALGAQARQVLRMILAQGAWLVGLGLVLGVAGAMALRQVLASVLFGVAPTDPVIFGVVFLVLSGSASSPAICRPAGRRGWTR